MAECEWVILCDYTFRDQRNKVCLIGKFDRIYAENVPATHHQAAVVARLIGEAHEKPSFRIEILRPTDGSLGKFEGTADLGDSGAVEVNLNIGRLVLPDFGSYAFQVFVDDQLSKEATFIVMKPPIAKTET